MKRIEDKDLDQLDGIRLSENEPFHFECRPDLACFNQCCRNLNLFLYPYDVLRLKSRLRLSADQFIEEYTDVILRPGNHFPDILLRMTPNKEQTCPFLTDKGCSVYTDRPYACRTFPTEHGVHINEETGEQTPVNLFRAPDFCLGQNEEKPQLVDEWLKDQGAVFYYKMLHLWSDVKRLFEDNPWGPEGPESQKGRMAFMAAYNTDDFKDFVFKSSFLKRYKVSSAHKKKMKQDETELLKFGFEWIKLFIWGIKSQKIKTK